MSFKETADLLIQVTRNLKPLQLREEQLKEKLRSNYPSQSYTAPDGSTVDIGAGGVARQDGWQLVFNEDRYMALSPEARAELERLGVIRNEPKMVRATVARVTVRLT